MLTIKEATLKIGEASFGFTEGSEDKSAFRLTRSEKCKFSFLFN